MIDNIMNTFYSQRDERDPRLLKCVQMYLVRSINAFIQHNQYPSSNIYHFLMTVPNKWSETYFGFIEAQMSEVGQLYGQCHTLHVIHESNALFRYIQHPSLNHDWKNGQNCVVVYFDYQRTMVYGYEIGKPSQGLKNVPHHTTCMYRTLDYDLEDTVELNLHGYLIKNCPLDIPTGLLKYCTNAFYRCLGNVDRSFCPFTSQQLRYTPFDKSLIIYWETITLQDLLLHVIDPILEPLRNIITRHSESYYDTRILFTSHKIGLSDILNYFTHELSKKFLVQRPISVMNDCNMMFIGSHLVMKDILRVRNYLPKVLPTEKKRYDIAVYLDVYWDQNRVYRSTQPFELLKSPAFDECFTIQPPIHGSSIHNICVTKQLLQFIQQHFDVACTRWERFLWKFNHKPKSTHTSPFQWEDTMDTDLALHHVSTHSTLYRRHLTRLFLIYLECLKLACHPPGLFYMTIHPLILETMLLSEETVHEITGITLIVKEQISAVYSKDQLACYKQLDTILLYPQYVIQVHMYPHEY
ncbi:hypothetical protein BDB01DRAFT_478504 [Pilobolus umbonatus]|nr:hypothetical protein BDB01DRAFT_478504 [Pilobolus umbonatus]